MLECDTLLHGRTISFLPYYTINILNLETGKEEKLSSEMPPLFTKMAERTSIWK